MMRTWRDTRITSSYWPPAADGHRFINCVHYYVLRGRFLGVLGEIETSLNCYDI